jgi:DNA oxidative demethylase
VTGRPCDVALSPSAIVLREFACEPAAGLLAIVASIATVSPFRQMTVPGGWKMSVESTNCGQVGWITDRTGYRYVSIDPVTARTWPKMPALFMRLAVHAADTAGFPGFRPDACLINRYMPGARLSLHQDRDERNFQHPIVSVSLGLPAIFLWGSKIRGNQVRRVPLHHGDVVVWGGADRLNFHGVHPVPKGEHPATGRYRVNLTFRQAR